MFSLPAGRCAGSALVTSLHRLITALAALTGLLLLPAGAAAADGTAASTAAGLTCLWPLHAGTAAGGDNIAWPDTSANYWIMTYPVVPDEQIVVTGDYADARYTSFNTYGPTGDSFTTDGVASALPDYRIGPDPGNVNPWQHAAAPGGHYTVTVRLKPRPGQVNTLPLAPAGTGLSYGFLVYRVYLSHSADPAAGRLPDVAIRVAGKSAPVPGCRPGNPAKLATDALVNTFGDAFGLSSLLPRSPSAHPRFARASGALRLPIPISFGAFPNSDNAYLSATVTPPTNGDVVVVRGKAPSTPSGTSAQPWPVTGTDMRFYSICGELLIKPGPVTVDPLPDGTVDYGCRADNQTRLDSAGYYTYVFGTEAQRAVIERIPGVTFVPFSSGHPTASHLLLLRNMLASSAFRYGVGQVPTGSSAADAARIMGDYYPRLGTCPPTTLATRACPVE